MKFLAPLLVGIFCLASLQAQAGAGVRAGLSKDPDQFYFGGHVDFGPAFNRLWMRPNVELGYGDHITLLSLNAEMLYFPPFEWGSWNLYVGGGPAYKIVDFNKKSGRRDVDEQWDLNLLAGLSNRRGFFGEVKFAAFEGVRNRPIPAVKFGFGYAWR